MSGIYQPSVEQQLQILREQTRLTGGLHEAQVLQLKLWPLVVFDNALGSKFTWDPETKTVAFTLDLPKKAKKKLAWWQERVEVLNSWVHTLLGEEWRITVSAGKETFRGQRKIVNGPKPGTQSSR